jgi:hypothetical protein
MPGRIAGICETVKIRGAGYPAPPQTFQHCAKCFDLLLGPSTYGQDRDQATLEKLRHDQEQRNKLELAQKEGELNKLLESATQFPVYYKVNDVPFGDERRIVLIMLRARIGEHWNLRDVVKQPPPGGTDSKSTHFWEITPKNPE